jgi:uncharacterized protein (DUF2384 family)
LVALREHLHLRLAEPKSLLAMSEATLARFVRQEGPLEPAVSERLDCLLEAIGLALGVFEDPLTTETWLKAPHPLLHHLCPYMESVAELSGGDHQQLLDHESLPGGPHTGVLQSRTAADQLLTPSIRSSIS